MVPADVLLRRRAIIAARTGLSRVGPAGPASPPASVRDQSPLAADFKASPSSVMLMRTASETMGT